MADLVLFRVNFFASSSSSFILVVEGLHWTRTGKTFLLIRTPSLAELVYIKSA